MRGFPMGLPGTVKRTLFLSGAGGLGAGAGVIIAGTVLLFSGSMFTLELCCNFLFTPTSDLNFGCLVSCSGVHDIFKRTALCTIKTW
jgi:hypothetical protein